MDEIEESVAPRRPARRTAFKSRKMMGSTKYRGGDRIRPVNWCFTIVTAFMILIPSIPNLIFV